MSPRIADYRLFWHEFRKTFHSTGAVLPSGRSLARALSRHVARLSSNLDLEPPFGEPAGKPARRILEVGPGTGVVTDEIVRRLGPNDTLDLVELNDRFAAALQDRMAADENWKRLEARISLHHQSIEDYNAAEPYDAIVSGLPFNNFSPETVSLILDRLFALAGPSCTLSYFEYVAIRRAKSLVCAVDERKRLAGVARVLQEANHRGQDSRQCVVMNVPPAWVHHLTLAANPKNKSSHSTSDPSHDAHSHS